MVRSPPTTSGLETEWDYSGRKGRDGQKKKIGKANERKGKVKRGKDEKVNGQGEEGYPGPTRGVSEAERFAVFKAQRTLLVAVNVILCFLRTKLGVYAAKIV